MIGRTGPYSGSPLEYLVSAVPTAGGGASPRYPPGVIGRKLVRFINESKKSRKAARPHASVPALSPLVDVSLAMVGVAFAGLQYIKYETFDANPRLPERACTMAAAVALNWGVQVWELAARLTQLGMPSRVHLWTPCLPPHEAADLFRYGPPFVVESRHDPALVAELVRLKARAFNLTSGTLEWSRIWLNNLLKWEVFNLDAGLAVFLDLDMEVMPRGLPPTAAAHADAASAAEEWHAMLKCAHRSGRSLLSMPDHSSPVNTAYLVVRPSRSLFLDGVRLLGRAASGTGFSQVDCTLYPGGLLGPGRPQARRHTRACMHVHRAHVHHAHACTRTCKHMHAHHARVRAHTCMHADGGLGHVYACIHIHMRIHMHIYMHACRWRAGTWSAGQASPCPPPTTRQTARARCDLETTGASCAPGWTR